MRHPAERLLIVTPGLILCGSVDDEQVRYPLADLSATTSRGHLANPCPPPGRSSSRRHQNQSQEADPNVQHEFCHRSYHRERPVYHPVSIATVLIAGANDETVCPLTPSPSYLVKDSVIFLCICDQSYPRKLAFTYLSDISAEFTSIYPSGQYLSSTAKSYGYIEFDTYIQKAKRSYQDSRATQNLDKLNDELKDVTKVMTKNIEELLYRGDSLDKMGEMSGRLREDSRKYKKAAVKINWDAMLAKVSMVFLIIASHGPPLLGLRQRVLVYSSAKQNSSYMRSSLPWSLSLPSS